VASHVDDSGSFLPVATPIDARALLHNKPDKAAFADATVLLAAFLSVAQRPLQLISITQ
jgi:hypothetical protein